MQHVHRAKHPRLSAGQSMAPQAHERYKIQGGLSTKLCQELYHGICWSNISRYKSYEEIVRTNLNISWACLTFPSRQDWFANVSTSLLPWFLWSNATAMRPVLPLIDARWFQSFMHLLAILAMASLLESLGCNSQRTDMDLHDGDNSSRPTAN